MVGRPSTQLLTVAAIVSALGPVGLGCSPRNRGPEEPAASEAHVRKVTIRGTKRVSGGDIKAGLASRSPSGWIIRRRTRLDRALIERDRARIETYYKSRGFFDAIVTDVEIKKIDEQKSDLLFTVDEGERSNVSEVEVVGLPAEVVVPLTVADGQPFAHGKYSAQKTKLLAALLEDGYAHAKVTGRAEADRRRREVALRYAVTPGPKVKFGTIAVRGLKIIPESAVRNRLKLSTGDTFHPRKITSSQSSIRGLGRFGVVRVDFVEQEPNAVGNVAVTVTEAPRSEVKAGGGVGIDQDNFEIRARAGYTRHGVIDPLLSFSAELRPAYAIVRANTTERNFVGEASASLVREDLIWPLARGKFRVSYDIGALEAYESRGATVAFGLNRPLLENRILLGGTVKLERLSFSDIDPAIDSTLASTLALVNPYTTGYFEQTVALELRDNPLNARRGFWAQVKMEEGRTVAANESFGFGRITTEARGYVPLSDRFGFAARAKAGFAAWGRLPITRRFLSGGSTTQRGFSQRRLSPVAGNIETSKIGIGGDDLFESVVEARVGVVKLGGEWLGVVLFADGADVVRAPDSIDPTNLHWASGLGLRYNTIVGPLRFDVGYRLTRAGANEIQSGDRFALHFSIGEAF